MDKIVKLCARRATAHLAAALFTTIVTTPSARAAEFIPLGSLPGERFSSFAHGVSDDGSVVVGQSNGGFVWTRETGMQSINDVIGVEGFLFNVDNVSGDGSTFVGNYQISGPMFESGMYRWSQAAGLLTIADVDNDHDIETYHNPASVSTDGSAFVGYVHEAILDRTEAFRYTDAGGFEPLGYLPGGGVESQALDISADGNVVVGVSDTGSLFDFEAFRWTRETGMVALGDLPGGIHSSSALAVSPDGSVIVGLANSERGTEAVRWTEETGLELLGGLPDGTPLTISLAVSDNGEFIVGGSPAGGFIWDASHGPRLLMDVLINEHGLETELEGWEIGARDISANGNFIVGAGLNPAGDPEAWLVIIPEPSSLILFVFAVTTLAIMRFKSA